MSVQSSRGHIDKKLLKSPGLDVRKDINRKSHLLCPGSDVTGDI